MVGIFVDLLHGRHFGGSKYVPQDIPDKLVDGINCFFESK